MCPPSDQRLRFTSGLFLESTNLCHISSISDDLDSFLVFGFQKFQISIKTQMQITQILWSFAMCPFGYNGLDLFDSSSFGNLISQPKIHYILLRAHDLFTSVLLQIDNSQLFDYSSFRFFNFSPLPSSWSHDPLTHTLLDLTVQILFGSPSLRTSGMSNFKLGPS